MKFLLMALSIATTVICWGIYGPILHWGQAEMQNSRLRPFICVGLAYFAVAVVAPLLLISALGIEKNVAWNGRGFTWSFIGGSLGALGALGIIMAFNFDGKPWFVMPLVFGGAPVVNTLFMIWYQNRWADVSPFFYAGLILVVAGAATVLVFAPRPKPHAGSAAHPPAAAKAE